MKQHHRHSIRLPGYDYSQNGFYFLTICTRNRECLFGQIRNGMMFLSEIGEIVDLCWQEIPCHFPHVVVREYVIMPNHIHGIIEICNHIVGANNYSTLQRPSNTPQQPVWANNYSPLQRPSNTPMALASTRPTGTSRTVGSVVRGIKIGVTHRMGHSPWQRNYYEHIIRNTTAYQNIVQYMVQNPMKWEEDCFYCKTGDVVT